MAEIITLPANPGRERLGYKGTKIYSDVICDPSISIPVIMTLVTPSVSTKEIRGRRFGHKKCVPIKNRWELLDIR